MQCDPRTNLLIERNNRDKQQPGERCSNFVLKSALFREILHVSFKPRYPRDTQ